MLAVYVFGVCFQKKAVPKFREASDSPDTLLLEAKTNTQKILKVSSMLDNVGPVSISLYSEFSANSAQCPAFLASHISAFEHSSNSKSPRSVQWGTSSLLIFSGE